MELPQAPTQTIKRDITGEIVYLNEMRRQNVTPQTYLELGGVAIQQYESEAELYTKNERPEILDAYEQYDYNPSEVVQSCVVLANELLSLKETSSPLTYVDIVVIESPATVLEMVNTTRTGSLLASDDMQLAIPSDGSYYPVADIRKQNAAVVGVGVRVWGWDYPKVVFTNSADEQYEYPAHALVYPSDEKSSSRQFELVFSYLGNDSASFTESVSLYISPDGSATISSSIWSAIYAETGYEGHGGSHLENPTEQDIAAFGNVIAKIIGESPQTVAMRINTQLQTLADSAATPSAQQVVKDLIQATWPAQANYFLHRNGDGLGKTIAEQLCDRATAEQATKAVHEIISEWTNKRRR